jgi:hypothetical protein
VREWSDGYDRHWVGSSRIHIEQVANSKQPRHETDVHLAAQNVALRWKAALISQFAFGKPVPDTNICDRFECHRIAVIDKLTQEPVHLQYCLAPLVMISANKFGDQLPERNGGQKNILIAVTHIWIRSERFILEVRIVSSTAFSRERFPGVRDKNIMKFAWGHDQADVVEISCA